MAAKCLSGWVWTPPTMSTATCSAARYCLRVIALANLLFRGYDAHKIHFENNLFAQVNRCGVVVCVQHKVEPAFLQCLVLSGVQRDKADLYFCAFWQNGGVERRHEEVCSVVGSRDSKRSIFGRGIEIAASH